MSTDQSHRRKLREWGQFVGEKSGKAFQLLSEDGGIHGICQCCHFYIWLWNKNSSIWTHASLSFSLFQLIPHGITRQIPCLAWKWIVMLCCWEDSSVGEMFVEQPWGPEYDPQDTCLKLPVGGGGDSVIQHWGKQGQMASWCLPNSQSSQLGYFWWERPCLRKQGGWHLRRNDTKTVLWTLQVCIYLLTHYIHVFT